MPGGRGVPADAAQDGVEEGPRPGQTAAPPAPVRPPLPVEVHGSETRHPADVETAVSFCCVEALQNVVTHAGATWSRVTVTDDGDVRFEVVDDGRGFPAGRGRAGPGLQNASDRLEALDGRLEVRSDRAGTCVRGSLPAGGRTPGPAVSR